MSRTAKLRISSRWLQTLRKVSNMSGPPAGSGRKSVRANRNGRRTLLLRNRNRHLYTLRLRREHEEHRARGQQQEVKVEICERNECAADEKRVERELSHLGVARDVSMLWMVAPALPKCPEGHERADEGAHIEAEAKQTVLTENLEVDAVRVKGLVVARSEIDGPDILVPERPEPGAREGATHRYVPRRLEGLQPSHRRHVPCLG